MPPALRTHEFEAARQQRTAYRLQAASLVVLLAAPVAQLVPHGGGGGIEDAVSAALLLAGVGMRLLLRRVGADSDWVRARRESEAGRSAAWRRCATGRPDPDDGPLSRQLGTADVAARWRSYRTYRVDDQIAYFRDRTAQHRRAAGRWRAVRRVLTVGTVAVAATSLAVPVPGAVIGLVSALLASSEAWLQFRRSEVLTTSFAEAGAELGRLREPAPTDERSLAAAVDAVELALERERWTWTAIMSVAVLTAPAAGRDRPA